MRLAIIAIVTVICSLSVVAHADEAKTNADEDAERSASLLKLAARYRDTGHYEESRRACLEAYKLQELRGLLCHARTAAKQGRYDEALGMVDALMAQLVKTGNTRTPLMLDVSEFRSKLQYTVNRERFKKRHEQCVMQPREYR